MSDFTETTLRKKLDEFYGSQQSIQTLSLWLIHHCKHFELIVKTWLHELEVATEDRTLIFMYLANDIIQNSKKKGPDYRQEFLKVLPVAFSHIGKNCKTESLIDSLGDMLLIWKERGVYDSEVIDKFRALVNVNNNELNASSGSTTPPTIKDAAAANGNSVGSQTAITDPFSTDGNKKGDKRKHADDESEDAERKQRDDSVKYHLHPYHQISSYADADSGNYANQHSILENANGNGNVSPFGSFGDPPKPEDLIKALISIENAALRDEILRELIVKLPPETWDMSCLNKLESKESARALSIKVNMAVDLLSEYNGRLAAEMEKRNKLAAMLRDFQAEQKELLAQAEKSLEEHKKKLNKVTAVQREIRDHLSNLPDMTQLPDVTELAPLPSTGDLFIIH